MSEKRRKILVSKSGSASIASYKFYFLLMAPGLLYFFIYKYIPMAGIFVAFKDISPFDGLKEMVEKPFIGFTHFKLFLTSLFFKNVFKNTIIISLMNLVFAFPAPILFTLILNEIYKQRFKKVVQTTSYLPHFLSMVIVAGLVSNILSTNGGLVNSFLGLLGVEPIFFLGRNDTIRWVIVGTTIWQEVGWNSVIYFAALTGIPAELYESAVVDGAGRWKQLVYITLPSILPIIMIMFILQMGKVLDVGFERVLLLYSEPVYQAADIIDTYVYRKGLIELQYSYSAAVGLFKSIIAFTMVALTNLTVRRLGQESLW